MLVIGLTGSIGMGKSTAAARFRELGIGVCDADAEVHKLYEGGPAVDAIEAAFPGTTTHGRVDRQKLAQTLLADSSRFARLEAIVHPMVRAAEREFLRAEMARGASMAVLEIPLLLEGGGRGTLVFTTTVPETPIVGAETVESGTVNDGTGALAGFEGTIENRFTFDGDGQPVGTYTVTLERTR